MPPAAPINAPSMLLEPGDAMDFRFSGGPPTAVETCLARCPDGGPVVCGGATHANACVARCLGDPEARPCPTPAAAAAAKPRRLLMRQMCEARCADHGVAVCHFDGTTTAKTACGSYCSGVPDAQRCKKPAVVAAGAKCSPYVQGKTKRGCPGTYYGLKNGVCVPVNCNGGPTFKSRGECEVACGQRRRFVKPSKKKKCTPYMSPLVDCMAAFKGYAVIAATGACAPVLYCSANGADIFQSLPECQAVCSNGGL